MMADKENLPPNWLGACSRGDEAEKMEPHRGGPSKHVTFRIEDDVASKGSSTNTPTSLSGRSGDEDGGTGGLSVGNVTPGNQTSEILMEKMRELREKLEKLKQKNSRKSVESGGGSSEGSAPSTPSTDDEKQINKEPAGDSAPEAAVRHSSPAASAVPNAMPPPAPKTVAPPHQHCPPPSPPNAQASAAAEVSPSPRGGAASNSVPSQTKSKARVKLPTPLGTTVSNNVSTRKKTRLPVASSTSRPPQRVTVDEARAQLESYDFNILSAAPEPVFRAPEAKGAREGIHEAVRPDIIKEDTKATDGNTEANSTTRTREESRIETKTRRGSREEKAVSSHKPTEERDNNQQNAASLKEQRPNSTTAVEVSTTNYTAASRPPGSTFTTGEMPTGHAASLGTTEDIADKMPSYKSPIPAKRVQQSTREVSGVTETHKSDREKNERTRDQDRIRQDTSTSENGHDQNGLSQEKVNLLTLAQHRGALEFLYTFATGDTSFLTVNGRRYMKLNQIGRGGSSKVYRVVSPNWTTYALKYVPLKNADTVTEESYLNEISLLKKLNHHDNIIRLVDSEVRSGGIFLLLEYAELDLDKMLKTQQQRNKEILLAAKENGQPPPSNLLPSYLCLNSVRLFWQQMLEAVHTIHEERVVHGDLKPANFVCIRGRLKLIDFGIAKAISNDTTNIVRDNQIGTLNYISPEALIDTSPGQNTKFKLGRASDIWSLGCILYQMVYGRSPFAMLDNMIRKLQAITNPNYRINYPPIGNPPLLETMKLCLKFDPRQRPTIPELLQHPFLQ